MDQRIEFYKAAFSKNGIGFDFPVFRETSRYQKGYGVGNILRARLRNIPNFTQFQKPLAMNRIQILLKAGSKVTKEGATIKDVIKFTHKPMVGAVLGATVDEVASKLIEKRNNKNDALSPNQPIMLPEFNQTGSGKTWRSQTLYKKKLK